jgi:O-methyltransferase
MVSDINVLLDFDVRSSFFKTAIRFIDYELIEGDIFEFGVYTGRSLALLSYFHEKSKQSIHKIDFNRNIVGFDSFDGLPESDNHPRWKKNMFGVNHSYHPTCKIGDKVTPDTIYHLFETYNLPKPNIEVGDFSHTIDYVIPSKYKKAAMVHIDCDLYESTKMVLNKISPIIQEGTLLVFDDWFNFKGNKNKGEQKAFYEYFNGQIKWNYIEYQTYATFGKSFIITDTIS